MGISRNELSKVCSHALRHEPWLYELELDEAGWAPLEQLLAALRARGGPWTSVDRQEVEQMIASSEKPRHDLQGDRIRALFGHSLPGRLVREPAIPPECLLHGTSPEVLLAIKAEGLVPMGRQYVHLSVDSETALAVGRRKHDRPVILQVEAKRAHRSGVLFYRGSDRVWLADTVPREFIKLE